MQRAWDEHLAAEAAADAAKAEAVMGGDEPEVDWRVVVCVGLPLLVTLYTVVAALVSL